MWVVGDWGQASPWSRDTGVKMVKGENDVYTGELSLPEGTEFDIKILKSTVSTTSGGDNTWLAVKYASTLNRSALYDFGEFTDNLIPNGNFEKGRRKWTPVNAITDDPPHENGRWSLHLGSNSGISSCSSDVFTIPPGQTLSFSGYAIIPDTSADSVVVTMKTVAPQQQTLFEFKPDASSEYHQFSKTFKSWDVPVDCQITISDTDNRSLARFDSLSLVCV